MSWESVKGFCRRQTQTFKVAFRHASKTEDAECDQLVQRTQVLTGQVQRMSMRLKNLSAELSCVVQQFEGTRDDLSSEAGEELSLNTKKIDLVATDLRQKHTIADLVIQDTLAQMTKFCTEASQLGGLIEDRKSKMLEFDFFRNKVADLRADPPTDTNRIPRNEARVTEWKTAYDESTNRLKRFCSVTVEAGQNVLLQATQTLMNESGKFFFEASKTTRVIFLGTKLSDHASHALDAIQQQASSTAAVVTSTATSVHATVLQATAPPPSNRRFVPDDDPFRL